MFVEVMVVNLVFLLYKAEGETSQFDEQVKENINCHIKVNDSTQYKIAQSLESSYLFIYTHIVLKNSSIWTDITPEVALNPTNWIIATVEGSRLLELDYRFNGFSLGSIRPATVQINLQFDYDQDCFELLSTYQQFDTLVKAIKNNILLSAPKEYQNTFYTICHQIFVNKSSGCITTDPQNDIIPWIPTGSYVSPGIIYRCTSIKGNTKDNTSKTWYYIFQATQEKTELLCHVVALILFMYSPLLINWLEPTFGQSSPGMLIGQKVWKEITQSSHISLTSVMLQGVTETEGYRYFCRFINVLILPSFIYFLSILDFHFYKEEFQLHIRYDRLNMWNIEYFIGIPYDNSLLSSPWCIIQIVALVIYVTVGIIYICKFNVLNISLDFYCEDGKIFGQLYPHFKSLSFARRRHGLNNTTYRSLIYRASLPFRITQFIPFWFCKIMFNLGNILQVNNCNCLPLKILLYPFWVIISFVCVPLSLTPVGSLTCHIIRLQWDSDQGFVPFGQNGPNCTCVLVKRIAKSSLLTFVLLLLIAGITYFIMLPTLFLLAKIFSYTMAGALINYALVLPWIILSFAANCGSSFCTQHG